MADRQATSRSDPTSEDRAAHVAELRRRVRVRAGEYRVDPGAVAGALLERLRTAVAGREAPNEDRRAAEAHQGVRRLIAA